MICFSAGKVARSPRNQPVTVWSYPECEGLRWEQDETAADCLLKSVARNGTAASALWRCWSSRQAALHEQRQPLVTSPRSLTLSSKVWRSHSTNLPYQANVREARGSHVSRKWCYAQKQSRPRRSSCRRQPARNWLRMFSIRSLMTEALERSDNREWGKRAGANKAYAQCGQVCIPRQSQRGRHKSAFRFSACHTRFDARSLRVAMQHKAKRASDCRSLNSAAQ